jgi:hypothetical protein
MPLNPADRLLASRPGSPSVLARPATALVVRSDSSGVYAAPVGSDPRSPIGPCRGAAPGGVRLPVGSVVLLELTDHGPWVAAVDEPEMEAP